MIIYIFLLLLSSLAAAEVPIPPSMPKPIKIEVAISLLELGEIVEKKESFNATLLIRCRWNDPSQAFDSAKEGTFRKEFDARIAPIQLASMWTPHLEIENLIGKPSRLEPGLFIKSNGDVEFYQQIEGQFHSDLRLRTFPFDQENLQIVIISPVYNKAELTFIQTEEDLSWSEIPSDVKLVGWTIKGLKWKTYNVIGMNGMPYPAIELNIKMDRVLFGHMIVLFPLVLVMLLPSFLTLYTKEDLALQVLVWGEAVIALIATTYSLNLRYPSLAPDSILNQSLLLFFFFQIILILLLLTLFNPSIQEKIKNKDLIHEVIALFRWALPLGFFTILVCRVLILITES